MSAELVLGRGMCVCHGTGKSFPWSRTVYSETEIKRGTVTGGKCPPSLIEIYFHLVKNILIFTYIPCL